jgi:hypothetical protein
MAHSRRSRFLRSQVEQLLAPARFLGDPYLVSALRDLSRLPVSALTGVRVFAKLRASPAEIAQACRASPAAALITDRGVDYLALPFQVNRTSLVVRGAAGTTTFAIGEFVRMLLGGIRHVAYPTSDGAETAVNFSDPRDCIAAWRAIQIVPLNGRILAVAAWSPPPRVRVRPVVIAALPVAPAQNARRAVAQLEMRAA